MKILIAIDKSPVSAVVVDFAMKIARDGSSEVMLINVAPRDPDMLGQQLTRKVIGDDTPPELADRRELLDIQARRFADASIPCSTLLIRGDAGPTLLREARRWNAGLIVMGSHGRGALYRKLVGSVSEAVLADRGFPVLVVPAQAVKTQ